MSRPRAALLLLAASLAPSLGASAPPRPHPARLQGRWAPQVRRALERLIATQGAGSPGYSPERPPAAVIAWDDTAVIGHPGEAVFGRLVDDAGFKFSDSFWSAVPAPHGRRARVGYEEFHGQPRVVWPKDPYYQMYREAMFLARDAVCSERGRRACFSWLAALLQGFGEEELRSLSARVLEQESVVPELESLARALAAAGFDVWALSSSNQWTAQAAAVPRGVHPSRVLGVRCRTRNGVLLPELMDPVPVDIGEAEALTRALGRGPELAVGGARNRNLLDYGGGLRLVIGGGDSGFAADARRRGWLLQPEFPTP